MKEKYDLSLDNRQVVSLLIAGIVVLGAVFVLGVLVGKKLSVTQHPGRAQDLLAALDERSAALDQARKAAPLTFQEELTTKTDLAAPEPQPSPLAPIRPPAVAAPASTSLPTSSVATRAVPDAARAAPRPEPKAEPVSGSKPEAPGPDAASAWTLQLSSSPNRAVAEKQVGRFRGKGYAPYIVTADVAGKGTWYRVRMGRFATKEAAGKYLQDFRRETKAEAFVASTK